MGADEGRGGCDEGDALTVCEMIYTMYAAKLIRLRILTVGN